MTSEEILTIIRISKEFAHEFKDTIGEIAGSGWLIVDPLSAYLNACGYPNTLTQIRENEKTPQILIITFEDGDQFIPAGSDIPMPGAEDWMWIPKYPKSNHEN